MKKLAFIIMLVLAFCMIFSVQADQNRSMAFDAEKYVVYIGKPLRLSVKVEKLTKDAPKSTKLVWSCDDTEIAEVASNGTVKGLSEGTAVVTVFAKDDPSLRASVTIDVRIPAKQILLDPKKIDLLAGGPEGTGELQLQYAVLPQEASDKVIKWTSSNEAVAKVDEDGFVTVVGPGRANIVGESECPLVKKVTCAVNVTQAVTAITLDQEKVLVPVGRTGRVKATIEPANAGSKKLTWMSGNTEIAKVDNSGNIRGVAAGETTITAVAADGSGIEAKCKVQVVIPTKRLVMDQKTLVLAPETSDVLSLVVDPLDATVKGVVWTSSNEKVATVDEDGIVTAVSKGTATITATAVDGSKAKATATVKVQEFDLVFKTQEPQKLQYAYGKGSWDVTGTVKTGCVSIPDITRTLVCESAGETLTEEVEVTPMMSGDDVITIKLGKKSLQFTVFVARTAFADHTDENVFSVFDVGDEDLGVVLSTMTDLEPYVMFVDEEESGEDWAE